MLRVAITFHPNRVAGDRLSLTYVEAISQVHVQIHMVAPSTTGVLLDLAKPRTEELAIRSCPAA